jgi:hypothetical protein
VSYGVKYSFSGTTPWMDVSSILRRAAATGIYWIGGYDLENLVKMLIN